MINKGDRQKVDTKGASVVSIDDTQGLRFAVCSALGSEQKVQAFSPYGLCSNPPDESLAIVFNIQGIAANKVALIDDPKNRKKGLSKGEVAIYNYATGAEVYLKKDGGIDIESPSGAKIVLLPDGTIEMTGDTTITGDLTVTGSVEAGSLKSNGDIESGSVSSFNAHTHSGVTTGAGNTGGPT